MFYYFLSFGNTLNYNGIGNVSLVLSKYINPHCILYLLPYSASKRRIMLAPYSIGCSCVRFKIKPNGYAPKSETTIVSNPISVLYKSVYGPIINCP